MSKWILLGPGVGAVFIILALVMGYAVVPPMVIQKIIEVKSLWIKCEKGFDQTITLV